MLTIPTYSLSTATQCYGSLIKLPPEIKVGPNRIYDLRTTL